MCQATTEAMPGHDPDMGHVIRVRPLPIGVQQVQLLHDPAYVLTDTIPFGCSVVDNVGFVVLKAITALEDDQVIPQLIIHDRDNLVVPIRLFGGATVGRFLCRDPVTVVCASADEC